MVRCTGRPAGSWRGLSELFASILRTVVAPDSEPEQSGGDGLHQRIHGDIGGGQVGAMDYWCGWYSSHDMEHD